MPSCLLLHSYYIHTVLLDDNYYLADINMTLAPEVFGHTSWKTWCIRSYPDSRTRTGCHKVAQDSTCIKDELRKRTDMSGIATSEICIKIIMLYVRASITPFFALVQFRNSRHICLRHFMGHEAELCYYKTIEIGLRQTMYSRQISGFGKQLWANQFHLFDS